MQQKTTISVLLQRIALTLLVPVMLVPGFVSCSKSGQDDVYPVIDMSSAEAFPGYCDTIRAGETFVFRALLTDNAELGSYSLDIHNNFDHHSHSGSVEECPLGPVKVPVNPLVLIREFTIPAGLKTFEATDTIPVPQGVDPGDYHLVIRLTDREGWQTVKGIAIKVTGR